jgi:hypothetical protein
MYHIKRALRYPKPMVDNRARVEGYNKAPTMWYNVDEEPPCSELSIFTSRGTTIGSSMS